MPFRKKVLYYGLMLFLTLLAIEGMARLAYYAAYGSGDGGGRAEEINDFYPPPPNFLSQRPTTGSYGIPFTAMSRPRRITT